MIDTHCHLLPGLDDGPRDDRGSVELARMLADQGVRRVICTPHYSAMFPTRHAEAVERHRAFKPLLASAGIELQTSVAAEVGPGYAATAPIDEVLERSIDGRYLLVEVLPDSSPYALLTIHERLRERSLEVVFGHPERAHALQRHPAVLDSLRAEGALLQVVAPSLIGRWGPAVQHAAWRLVDTGRADLLASDAHGPSRRRPHLRAACDLIEERLGGEVVAELTERKPQIVLDGAA